MKTRIISGAVLVVVFGLSCWIGSGLLWGLLCVASLIIMIFSLLSSIRAERNVFFPLIETAFYGVFTYLAHTEAY